MRYILAIKAKRKNARRHIYKTDKSIEVLRRESEKMSNRYTAEIYTGNWKLVEVVKGE